MKAIEDYRDEQAGEDELLALIARGIREAHDARRSRLRVVDVDEVWVSRRDWVHGLVSCPGCGKPLDPKKDLDAYVQEVDQAQASGVAGHHRRCGAFFRFSFAEARR